MCPDPAVGATHASPLPAPLRIDYLSPLPPVRSGISDYSVDLLPHLRSLAAVRVMRLPGQPVAAEIEERFQPVLASETGNEGRLPLYQMGNNPYHDGVYDLALERPGVLTLHDLVLHHLVLHRTLGQRDWAGYERRMIEDHGWIGDAACRLRALSLEDEASLFTLPVHRDLLRRQRGVLVHSRWAREILAEEDAELRVVEIPMGIPLPAPADFEAGRQFRLRHGVPDTARVLGSFGFQTPIKRTAAALAALSDPRLAAVHLLVVGETSPGLDFAALARAAGVADRVHVTGFVPFREFEAAIGAVDLCLNLRYPTAGETSASLLRVMAAGRPAVVSDFAQFAELPAEIALRVPLGDGEAAGLATTLAELLAQPERLRRMSAQARTFVAQAHRPEDAALKVVEACRELEHRAPPGSRSAAPPPPTSLTWSGLAGSISVSGLDAPWVPGTRRRLTFEVHNAGPARWLASHRGVGSVAFEVGMEAASGAPTPPWLAFERDLAAGEHARFELELRRPLGPARLWAAVRVLDPPGCAAPVTTAPRMIREI